ncbi:MAG: T9SS type A sorting domain-containing protein [Candidatus Delongbacteria bacterium]|nr:T9SS type A sorting domain-containing protein [Candidatus Dojkabacteria bacterium]MBN2836505.1 T9SS type A sorting domain-containing protein [Candidatus Delongbacteria bacterium]
MNNINYGIDSRGLNALPDLGSPINYMVEYPFDNNTIQNNGSSPIYLDNSSRIRLINGSNNIYAPTNVPLIYKDATGTIRSINATNNYWGVSTVTASMFYPTTGNWLTFSPYATSPFPQTNPGTESDAGERMLAMAGDAESEQNYSEAETLYMDVVETYPNSPASYVALSNLQNVYTAGEMDMSELETVYTEKLSDPTWEDDKFMEEMIVKTRISSENYDNAIAKSENMIANATSNEEVILASIDIAIAESMRENNGRGNNGDNTVDANAIKRLVDQLFGNETGDLTDIPSEHILPLTTELHQNYPNPFNPVTTISYSLSYNSNVKLVVMNIEGKKVKSYEYGTQNAGKYSMEFDASSLASGVYMYKLLVNNREIETRKMVLVK